MEKGSVLVQGEDSESDEEINTETMTPSMETSLRRQAAPSHHVRGTLPGVVAGEGSETDEEDGGAADLAAASEDQADGGATLRLPSSSVSHGSSPRSGSRRSSGESSATFPPPSLLHKKLRERNVSLRRNIVERILRIYHATCRNLTIVNDNLSRNQATIEKVNSHLKKAGQDLEKVNTVMQLTTEGMCNFAPTLRMDVSLRPKTTPSAPPTTTSRAQGAAAVPTASTTTV